jgi:hypothetical protein
MRYAVRSHLKYQTSAILLEENSIGIFIPKGNLIIGFFAVYWRENADG